jgi:hypothetical protein
MLHTIKCSHREGFIHISIHGSFCFGSLAGSLISRQFGTGIVFPSPNYACASCDLRQPGCGCASTGLHQPGCGCAYPSIPDPARGFAYGHITNDNKKRKGRGGIEPTTSLSDQHNNSSFSSATSRPNLHLAASCVESLNPSGKLGGQGS